MKLQICFGPKIEPLLFATPEATELFCVLKLLRINFESIHMDYWDTFDPRFPYMVDNSVDSSSYSWKQKIHGALGVYDYIMKSTDMFNGFFMFDSSDARLMISYMDSVLKTYLDYHIWSVSQNFEQVVKPKLKGNFPFLSGLYFVNVMRNLFQIDKDMTTDSLYNQEIEKIFQFFNNRCRNKFLIGESLTYPDVKLFSYILFVKCLRLENSPLFPLFISGSALQSHYDLIEERIKQADPNVVLISQNEFVVNEKYQNFVVGSFIAISVLVVFYFSKYVD